MGVDRWTTVNLRIGPRYEVDDAYVAWRVDRPQSRRKWRSELHMARLVDVSASGAGFLAPNLAPELKVDDRIAIRADGVEGIVIIQRILEAGDPSMRLYGVAFMSEHADFMQYFEGLMNSPNARLIPPS